MKYQYTSIATTLRHFRALATKLRRSLKDKSFWQLDASEQHRLLSKFRQLHSRLRHVMSSRRLRPLVAGIMLLLAAPTVLAQTFSAPQNGPFGLSAEEQSALVISFPQFGDLDNDGDLDILATSYHGDGVDFFFVENTGTLTSPNFIPAVANTFGLPSIPSATTPILGDLDNDGDLDIIVGNYTSYDNTVVSSIRYFENTGTASTPSFGEPQINPFGLEPGDSFTVPQLVDLDNDGDLDFVFADYQYDTETAFFVYQENIGTSSAPAFADKDLELLGAGLPENYATFPIFSDIDNDGDFDMVIGFNYGLPDGDSYRAYVSYRENTGTTSAPAFEANDVNEPFGIVFPSGSYLSLTAMADLDDDGDDDLLSFTYLSDVEENAFMYFENTSPVSTENLVDNAPAWKVYPTVSRDFVNWNIADDFTGSLSILNNLGQRMQTQLIEGQTGQLDLSMMPSGIYWLLLNDDNGQSVARTQVVKQ